MTNFKLTRIGTMMEPQAGDPNEVEGVLNPAVIRAKDGQLISFPAWWLAAIIPESASSVCCSMPAAIR